MEHRFIFSQWKGKNIKERARKEEMNSKGAEEWKESVQMEALDDLSSNIQREEILKGLEEEFRKGLQEVRRHKKEKEESIPEKKQDRIYSELYLVKKGSDKWESIRSATINNTPITLFNRALSPPENRKDAYKINLKEGVLFFNVSNDHLLVITETGVIKIFAIMNNCQLQKVWEISNHLFVFLIKTKSIPHSVADTLSIVLIQLYYKKVKEIEKVFEGLLSFCRISTIKKAFFFNGYLCMVSSFGEMQIFDETLREIPIGKNIKSIIKSILKEPAEKKEHINRMVKSEITITLRPIIIKILKDKVKMIYSKKSVYEEISFSKNEQVVYNDNILFLKEKTTIHAIILG
ncbi:hypothetical protein NEMIN01_1132 [Nematocida minor]|uniref:uncharacterized protein n=1 Tax=Nematocida minor TaxID=1912983 RepID=UPI00222109CB|nr:uncharacterized protein NEMIN01_1132 [Nematocida minor]KAI5190667.1 hypothetical protein NEMIN01_1132 [Nematocida minor]